MTKKAAAKPIKPSPEDQWFWDWYNSEHRRQHPEQTVYQAVNAWNADN